MDALFFEVHIHANVTKHSHELETVHGVSCESGDGLDDDHVYLALLTSADHAVKLIALFVARSGDTLVSVDAFEYPAGFGIDAVGVVLDLRFVAVELFLLFGGYSAVGCHSYCSVCVVYRFLNGDRRFYYSYDLWGFRGLLLYHVLTPFL